MKIIGGTTNNFEVFLLTNTFLAINVVKDGRIIFIIGIVGKFLMRAHWNSQVFKYTDQIMTFRLTNVDGIAATARITIKKMRTYTKWNPIFKHKEILQSILAFENYLNSAGWEILRRKSGQFTLEFKRLFAQKWQANAQLFLRNRKINFFGYKHFIQKSFNAFVKKMTRIRISHKNHFQKYNFFMELRPTTTKDKSPVKKCIPKPFL